MTKRNHYALWAVFIAFSTSCAIKEGPLKRPKIKDYLVGERVSEIHACPVWSNWKQVCSTFSRDGQIYCVDSAVSSDEYSATFCANNSVGYDDHALYKRQLRSVKKYCAEEAENGSCAKFEESRPLNGRRISERLHPWCLEWSDYQTEEVVCQVAEGEAPGCNDLAEQNYEHSELLYCTQWSLPDWCERAADTFYIDEILRGLSRQEDGAQEIGLVYFGRKPPGPSPVYGVWCTQVKGE